MDDSVSFTIADGADVLASLLAPAGFESFSTDQEDASVLLAYIPRKLADNNTAAETAASLADITGSISASIDSIEEIEGQDWNEEWEKHYFQPIVVAGRCVIHSSFHKDYPICPLDITIDPKMAFGTGHHATTSLMARFLLDNDITGKSVIDMGTGTGLLAIIAAMRGASPVTAIEIDPPAKDNAMENVALNGHSEINVILGDASALADVAPADFFFANINRNVILADLQDYAAHLKPDGIMALSGFYEQDIEMLLEAAAPLGLYENSRSTADTGWASLILKRR
ncbi:MAG: 50S ribosomal protein L11 methyltransferase [Muribaculaceae bacterium]|nr:50S ribosomal protein L11 methyltransferase [Muribaculaceae bacterium]